MNFQGLKLFCDVVRYHSFSKAAKAHGVSQSATSQAVHQLERRLGVELIDRTKRPWTLTQAGKQYFEGCQEIVDRYAELEVRVRRVHGPSEYTVRVAAIYSVGYQDIGLIVDRFRALVPGADAEIRYMHPDAVCETVMDGEADLGLLSYEPPGSDFEVTPWRKEPMVVACLPDHPIARRGARAAPRSKASSVSPAELEGAAFVGFQKGLAVRREVDRYLRRVGAAVRVVAEFDNIATIKQAVEEGVGLSILPEPTLRREIERRALVAWPLEGEAFTRPLNIIYRKKRSLNSAVLSFLGVLQNAELKPAKVSGATPAATTQAAAQATAAQSSASQSTASQSTASQSTASQSTANDDRRGSSPLDAWLRTRARR